MWTTPIIISFVAVVALTLTAQNVFAEDIIKGKDYTNQLLERDPVTGQEIWRWTSSPDRILHNGEYKDYILTEDATNIRLETGNAGSIVFNKNSCSYNFHAAGYIDELNTPRVKNISWAVKGKLATATTWSNISAINNAACNVTVETTETDVKITGAKTNTSGTFQIVIQYKPGNGFKELMRGYNNNPAWTNHHIGFTETFEVPRIISFGNRTYDLANYDGTTLGRNWIENNHAYLVHFGNELFYDFGIGYDNLNDIKISWDGSVAKLSMNYLYTDQIVPYQTWFEVDPTFGWAAASNVYTAETTASATTSCATGVTKTSGDGQTLRKYDSADVGGYCRFEAAQWNTSSIPNNVTIQQTRFRLDISATVSDINCDVTPVSGDITSITAAQLMTDIQDGTPYVSNNTYCKTNASDVTMTLGTQANTDLQNGLTSDRFAVGIVFTDRTRDGTTHNLVSTGKELEVTYAYKPPQPTSLTATSNARQVQFTWTTSDGSGTIGYYIGRSLDNSTWPAANKTSVGNVTSYLSSAYFRPGLLYYVNVTAGAALNSTAKFSSFTMDGYPSAPTLANPLTRLSAVALNASSTAGASDGGDTIDDFALRCEKNVAGGWQSVVSNSSIPANRKYTISGFWSQGDFVSCQWRDGNDVGWSAWSNNATYPAAPDAVDDLEVVAVFQTTAQISWTAPDLHGLTLIGYQVNYTSPWGTPLTEIITTNSSDVEYTILGLTPNTQYSFRVSAVTIAGNNATGNIVNVATITDFSVGDIDLDDVNPLMMPIRFSQNELNDTTTELTVTYDNDYELDCSMYFQFAQDTQDYENLNGTAVSDDEDEVIFYFNNAGNEVITIDCTDALTNNTGRYQMMQSDFVLLDLINGFRDGTYGTQGQFGVIDLITLLALIFGMVGFNRVNPSVGVIFMFFIMGGLAAFQIVQWYTAVSGMVALIIMLVVSSTRKDD